nr:unnamed protein product [Digitaria exilis]
MILPAWCFRWELYHKTESKRIARAVKEMGNWRRRVRIGCANFSGPTPAAAVARSARILKPLACTEAPQAGDI